VIFGESVFVEAKLMNDCAVSRFVVKKGPVFVIKLFYGFIKVE